MIVKVQHPKVVLIGAGSIFFGRQAIWQMVQSEHLRKGTLSLVDTNPVHLARMKALADQVVAHTGAPLKVESSIEAKAVLKGADFVVLSFADNSVKYRAIDCAISQKYGIRMCSGDTIGPGGIMRTLREFPHILKYCRQIERLCPDVWVINYINPTAANGIGLRLFAPKLKSFALCDGLHMPKIKRLYAQRAGIIKDDKGWSPKIDAAFDFRIAGPNHFTWLLKAEYKGRDVTPAIAETIRKEGARETEGGDTGAKMWLNKTISYELYKAFGRFPTCTPHTKEYVRFWQGLGRTAEPIPPLAIWEAEDRYERHAAMWNEVDGYLLGTTPIQQFLDKTGPDHATDVIEAMWSGSKKPFFVNTANQGAVPNMPNDAFLEIMCNISMDAITPRPVGCAPLGLRGLWQQVLDTHELTARAAVSGDRDLLYRAFLCDPLVSSMADSQAMIHELLAAEKDVLPSYWQ
jgi:alpha-galactosidase